MAELYDRRMLVASPWRGSARGRLGVGRQALRIEHGAAIGQRGQRMGCAGFFGEWLARGR